jgi:hypothetical protein
MQSDAALDLAIGRWREVRRLNMGPQMEREARDGIRAAADDGGFVAGLDAAERIALRSTHTQHALTDGREACWACSNDPVIDDWTLWPCPVVRLLDFYEARTGVTPSQELIDGEDTRRTPSA